MGTPQKGSKGSVGIESFQGRLRLRLPRQIYGGKQKYFSLGLPDTLDNRKVAEAKAHQIELDIISDNFDFALTRYKPKSHLTVVETIRPKPELNLSQLWDMYETYKKPQVSQSTLAKDYKKTRNMIQKLPDQSLEQAIGIRDYLIANYSPNAAKRYLVQLSACCNWGMRSKHIKSNPFRAMASDIKLQRNTEGSRQDAFSADEKDSIISAFESNRYYSYYAPLVKFYFLTGCRPSEAVALRWQDISSDFRNITFCQAATISVDGIKIKKGLKTQQKRTFPVNAQLRELLQSIKPEDCQLNFLVFPSPEGGLIDVHNFCNRAWKSVLQKLDIPYRTPYSTRHTFITLCLEKGLDAKDVARWVGNSAEIIYKHYASNKRDLAVPVL
jgi:integrase